MVCFGKERIGVGYEILVGMGLSFFTTRRYIIPNYYYFFFAYPIYPQFSNIYKRYLPAGGLIESPQ